MGQLRRRAALRARERRVELGLGPLRDALTSPVGVADPRRARRGEARSACCSARSRRRGRRPAGCRSSCRWPPLVAAASPAGSASRSRSSSPTSPSPASGSSTRRPACSSRLSLAAALAWLLFRVVLPLPPGACVLGAGRLAGELVDLDLPVDLERRPRARAGRGAGDARRVRRLPVPVLRPGGGRGARAARRVRRRPPLRLAPPAAAGCPRQRRSSRRRRPRPRVRRAASGRCTTCSSRTRTSCARADLRDYAGELGLDDERFWDDLRHRAHARARRAATSTAPTAAAWRARRRSSSTAGGTSAPTTRRRSARAVRAPGAGRKEVSARSECAYDRDRHEPRPPRSSHSVQPTITQRSPSRAGRGAATLGGRRPAAFPSQRSLSPAASTAASRPARGRPDAKGVTMRRAILADARGGRV